MNKNSLQDLNNQDQKYEEDIISYDDYDNINVVVRVRPLCPNEGIRKDNQAVQFPGEGQIHLKEPGAGKPKTFTFNVVFEPEANQDDVFEHCGIRKLLDMSIDGFACTAFAYGQTGSGKTYTLIGPQHEIPPGSKQQKRPSTNCRNPGMVQKSFTYLFRQLNKKQGAQYVVQASYLEIYNEMVIDLLNPNKSKHLQVRWSKDKGFYAENLFVVECEGPEDLESVLDEGVRNRVVRCHSMNEYSSRSHTILALYITSETPDPDDPNVFIRRDGKLSLVDLAGSEKTKKTNSKGDVLVEANNINKSLLALGNCISALGDPKKRQGHIPYRDSVLTKLLSDGLGGTGVTLMIACISPSKNNASETMNTLRYASRAKRIKSKPIVVMDPRQQLLMSLKREIKLLRMENAYLREQLEKIVLPNNGMIPEDGPAIDGGGDGGGDTANNNPISAINGEVNKDRDDRKDSVMLPDFMQENEILRKENAQLHQMRELLTRDQELVCRENERLYRKLADVERVCSRSPIMNESPLLKSFIGPAPGSRGSNSESLSSSGTFNSSYWNTVLEINGSNENSPLPPSTAKNDESESKKNVSSNRQNGPKRQESPGGGKPPHHLDKSINQQNRQVGNSLGELNADDEKNVDTKKSKQRRNSLGDVVKTAANSSIPIRVNNNNSSLKKLPPLPKRKNAAVNKNGSDAKKRPDNLNKSFRMNKDK